MYILINDQSNRIVKLELGNLEPSPYENDLISLHSIAVGNMNRYNGILEKNAFILCIIIVCLYKNNTYVWIGKNNIFVFLVSDSEYAGGEMTKSSKQKIEEPRSTSGCDSYIHFRTNAEAGPFWQAISRTTKC